VIIVGGGFGGLYAAKALARQSVEVVLIDRHNYHLFQPLLYQVATAALSPGDIASPIRSILRRHRSVQVRLDEVKSIDLARREVRLESGPFGYDYLILATGVRHSYFGHDEWEPLAPGLKSLDDALEMRRRILLAFEAAEKESDPAKRSALLSFVVVGGGPTGVELAGAIAEIARHTVARDFRVIDPTQARVLLLEAGPRILSAFAEALSARAQRSLERLGVTVRTGAAVTRLDTEGVWLKDELLPTGTALWAAGVAASPLAKSLGVALDRAGRVVVEPDLSVPGHPEAFVIGDLASFSHQTGKPLPGLAPVAIQMGKAVARSIANRGAGRPTEPFRYWDRGTMATIGRASGIAEVGKLKLWGFAGWMAWLFIHLLFLIGFRNRLLVMLEWTWLYLTFRRGARLITGDPPTTPGRLASAERRGFTP
jgi:NADH dehydrogenase